MLAALGTARLLVPVVAVLGEVETGADGLAHDKSSDMAAVLLQRRGRPHGAARLHQHRDAGRVGPRGPAGAGTARTAALAAVQDGAEALLIDLAGPVTVPSRGTT